MKFNNILCVLFFTALIACSDNGKKSEDESKEIMTGSNAELAIIMRQIHEDAKELKTRIMNGEDLDGELPDYLQRIIAAETTDSTVNGPLFEAFATGYINNIEQMYADTSGSQRDLFNAAIETCIECHGEFCPGPVKTIQRLRIP